MELIYWNYRVQAMGSKGNQRGGGESNQVCVDEEGGREICYEGFLEGSQLTR